MVARKVAYRADGGITIQGVLAMVLRHKRPVKVYRPLVDTEVKSACGLFFAFFGHALVYAFGAFV